MTDPRDIIQSLVSESGEILDPTPWPERVFDDDFILISEFSELEGPKPVLTIPPTGGGAFDKNTFAVKVLSVDCNSLALPGINLGGFQIVGDTQVFFSDVSESIVSFVYHYTLYDIQARGFVRPFCMAYIKHSSSGTMEELQQLNTAFHTTSQCLRLGNTLNFLRNIKRRKNYLKALLDELDRLEGETFDTSELKNITRPMVNDYMRDTNDLLRIFTKYLNDLFSQTETSTKDEAILNNLLDLVSERDSANQSDVVQSAGSIAPDLLRDTSPRSLGITSGRKFDTPLEELDELCGAGYEFGMTTLKEMACVSRFEHKRLRLLEKSRGIFSRDHGLFGIRSLYRTVSGTVHSPCSKSRLLARVSSFCGSDSKDHATDRLLRAPSFDVGEPQHLSVKRCSSSPSLVTDHPPKYQFPQGVEMMHIDPASLEPNSLYPPLPYSFQSANSSAQNLASTDSMGWLDMSLFLTETRLTRQVVEQNVHRFDSVSSTQSDGAPMQLSSSSFSSLPDGSPVESYLANANVEEQRKVSPTVVPHKLDATMAKLIIKMIRRYSFMPHVIFSILIGRPVILLADISNEERVQSIIKILSFFLPDHAINSTSAVISWITGPLHISLLAKAKLIGLAKSSGPTLNVPKSVRCYVSIFDVDNATFIAPAYNGLLLHDLFDSRKDWPTIVTFVEYMHSVGLKLCSLTFAKFASMFASYELGIADRSMSGADPAWHEADGLVNVNKAAAVHSDLHEHDVIVVESLVNVLSALLIQSNRKRHGSLFLNSDYPGFEQAHHETFEMKLNRFRCTLFKASAIKKK